MFRTRAIMLENKDMDKMGNLNGKKGGVAELKERRGMKRGRLTFSKLEISLNSGSTSQQFFF